MEPLNEYTAPSAPLIKRSRIGRIGAAAAGFALGWSAVRWWRHKRSPETQPATRYEFVLEALRPGDIILSTIPLSGTHALIRRVTGSCFSHAAIYTGRGRVLEAHRKPGVTRASLKNVYIGDRRNICVLRLSTDIPDESGIRERAVAAAEEFYAAYYSLGGAACAALAWLPSWTGSRIFCSQLVAASFRKGGADLLPGRAPHKIVPGALMRSPLLRQVTGQILQAAAGNDLLPHPLVDREQQATPHHEEVALEQDAVLRLNQLLPRSHRLSMASLLATCENLATYAIAQPEKGKELDEQALVALRVSKLLSWYAAHPSDQEIFHDLVADARRQLAATGAPLSLPADVIDWLRRVYFGMPEDNQQRRQALNDYRLLQQASGLTVLGAVAESYGGFVNRMEERQAVIETILGNVASG